MEPNKQRTFAREGENLGTEFVSPNREWNVPVLLKVSEIFLPERPGWLMVPTVVIVMLTLTIGYGE